MNEWALLGWCFVVGACGAVTVAIGAALSPCTCRRASLFYSPRHPHVRGWWALVALWALAGVFVTVLGVPFEGAFFTQSVYCVIAIILHEKDKIRRAAKAAGKVVVDAFGRLRVHVPSPQPQGA